MNAIVPHCLPNQDIKLWRLVLASSSSNTPMMMMVKKKEKEDAHPNPKKKDA